jgi:hypothetical protein
VAPLPPACGPVHFDPHRLCPAPDGRPHVTALVQLTDLIFARE